ARTRNDAERFSAWSWTSVFLHERPLVQRRQTSMCQTSMCQVCGQLMRGLQGRQHVAADVDERADTGIPERRLVLSRSAGEVNVPSAGGAERSCRRSGFARVDRIG